MSGYAVVDAGTSSTRVRWWQEGEVRWSGSRPVGARDTAMDGHDGRLRGALRELLAALARETGAEPEAVVCSGMITSNMGLYELPHLPAPASLDAIAAGIAQVDFPDLWPRPLSFVPGVRSLPNGAPPPPSGASPHPWPLGDLPGGDVLRGEEAEIAGLHPRLGLDRDSVFLHLGSHHKAIDVGADGAILGSRSAITGELLAAVREHTILKSSTTALEGLSPDPEAVMAGAEATRQHGLGRALFLVRVGEQQAGLGRERMTSYLLGALAALDLPLLAPETGGEPSDTPVVVYGTGLFPELLTRLLLDHGWLDVRLVPAETADLAAADGAVRLYRRAQALGAVP